MTCHLRLSVLAACTVAMTLPAAAETAATETLEFAILRDGAKIGRHTVAFRRDGTRLDVEMRGEIVYKIAFVTLYRYQQRRTESWDHGKLVAFTAWTDDDGEVSELAATRAGDDFRITATGGSREVRGDAIPENYWSPATVRLAQLIDNVTGRPYPIAVTPVGHENVRANGGDVPAQRYRVTGGLGPERARDLWYDQAGRWVHMQLTARDGSKIEFVLR
jgi:hypothetical protein